MAKDRESPSEEISRRIQKRFWRRAQIRSFDEFLDAVLEQPARHVRSAAHYLRDVFDHFGTRLVSNPGGELRRFKLFDMDFVDGQGRIYGQEQAQNQIYASLSAFVERGASDRIIVLHGPNGTGKTSLVQAMMSAMEYYSQLDTGALYSFSWVFSEGAGRDELGFTERLEGSPEDSLAHIDAGDLGFKISCDLRDNPLLLLPRMERSELLAGASWTEGPRQVARAISGGDLCQKCRAIYNELLSLYRGDFARVMRHVQVNRYYVSKRYRRAAITIEPQRNVDASSRPLNLDRKFVIPPLLQQANLQEVHGELIDGNHGLVEYSDFFKRPLEMNKYLLTTSEQGTVNLSSAMAYLDLVLFATSNTKHLSLFRESPDFTSFKARMELVRVPYLLSRSTEAAFYADKLRAVSRGKHVGPHVPELLGLWAVLTRLRRPRPGDPPSVTEELCARLSASEKAELYDAGHAPADWSEADRQQVAAERCRLATEFDEFEAEFEGLVGPEYEGRRGVSPREILTVINDAALSSGHRCLSPLSVLEAIRSFTRDPSSGEFLRLDTAQTYGEVDLLTKLAERELRAWVGRELRDCTRLIAEQEYSRLFETYVEHVKHWTKGERLANPLSGQLEEPSQSMMVEVEEILGVEDPTVFRRSVILRIAGWALDHRGEALDYRQIFSRLFETLRHRSYERRSDAVESIHQNILKHGTAAWGGLLGAEQALASAALDALCDRSAYCVACAKEMISYMLPNEEPSGGSSGA